MGPLNMLTGMQHVWKGQSLTPTELLEVDFLAVAENGAPRGTGPGVEGSTPALTAGIGPKPRMPHEPSRVDG
jgi:hypothetical protein